MAKIAGTLFWVVNGQQLELAMEGVEVPLAQVQRESLMSTTGRAGYKETPQLASIKGTVFKTPDFPLQMLATLEGATVSLGTPTGTYTLSGAVLEGEHLIDAYEGKVPLHISGDFGAWS